ncbi:lipoprotein N-acyltransferase Lnb domain-containing protein [Mangrovimonas aestuarii]|uniref:lipoprotein N-acyltransferase Lnb domain-containing protein n=1 Tax=Mangrovimonas aestuarii TaxID=3018443 RepID=UPI002379437A|nr:DUF4105 domain-containing protein [Mangrovimonas aestuarii]
MITALKTKLALILCLFNIVAIRAQGKAPELSDRAQVSILTMGPGQNLNDAFGHNAIRIKDPLYQLDIVFNYGVYDFSTPNFYGKFAQGKLNYLLGVNRYADMLNSYMQQNRLIREQILAISKEQKQAFADYLYNNAKPENRAYLYDFFYDNCATKIRDVSQISLNNEIKFHAPNDFQPKTFRENIHDHVNQNSWGSLGIDLALGSIIDRTAKPEEHMFLPKYIFDFFANATHQGNPLVKETKVIFEPAHQKVQNSWLVSPLVVFGILACIVLWLTYLDIKRGKRNRILDGVIFSFTGVLGVFLLLLWFATDHTATAQNYNLLWAFPINLFALLQAAKALPKRWFTNYISFLIIMLGLMGLHWVMGVQQFPIGVLPLYVALLVRYIYIKRNLKSL